MYAVGRLVFFVFYSTIISTVAFPFPMSILERYIIDEEVGDVNSKKYFYLFD